MKVQRPTLCPVPAIEVIFDREPRAKVCREMKANGFHRLVRMGLVWVAKETPERVQFVEKRFGNIA